MAHAVVEAAFFTIVGCVFFALWAGSAYTYHLHPEQGKNQFAGHTFITIGCGAMIALSIIMVVLSATGH